MSEAVTRRNQEFGNFVPSPSLTEYGPRYAEHFVLDRLAGVLTIRMHSGGGAAIWSRGLLNAWNLLLRDVGADRDNEVIVITGTGSAWIGGIDTRSFSVPVSRWHSDLVDEQYNDGIKVLERLVLDIDVPTIAAINGPGPRQEIALLCDMTLCAEQTTISDGNFAAGSVPGDGMHLALSELIGPKRAAHAAYTRRVITAAEAAALGIVNEVHSEETLLPRAHELAQSIARQPRTSRRLTHAVVSRRWQRRVIEDLRATYALQLLAMSR
jgi:enoyl-CoA hydratase/carnithine racemase